MNDILGKFWKEPILAYSKYYPIIFLEKLKKIEKQPGEPTSEKRIEPKVSRIRSGVLTTF
jgi:hypothetical protein